MWNRHFTYYGFVPAIAHDQQAFFMTSNNPVLHHVAFIIYCALIPLLPSLWRPTRLSCHGLGPWMEQVGPCIPCKRGQ